MFIYPSSKNTTLAELGEVLRTRRDRIAPATVGLPPGGRRRTPGLRREEVASLAGVGLTWYTWLEQGRDIRVSAAVLERIARALRLEGTKRFDHPKLGRLDLEYTPFEIAEQPSLRLYLFAPADSNTEAKLRAVLS